MKTQHGYSDTSKFLREYQWENATTEQRQGFLAEGYVVLPDKKLGKDGIELFLTFGRDGQPIYVSIPGRES